MLNYTDHDLTQIGSGYNWIHSDDLKYYATAHKERKNCQFERDRSSQMLCFDSIENRDIGSSLLSAADERWALAVAAIFHENYLQE